MKLKLAIIYFLMISFASMQAHAEGGEGDATRYTISGNISDKESGERLAGATVYIPEIQNGAMSNEYGFYSISLIPGKYTLMYKYMGYVDQKMEIELTKDRRINIKLQVSASTLKEVEITSKGKNENVRSSEMSVVKMDIKTINKIPAFMGEVDILKNHSTFTRCDIRW
jgi:hypothetical protein